MLPLRLGSMIVGKSLRMALPAIHVKKAAIICIIWLPRALTFSRRLALFVDLL